MVKSKRASQQEVNQSADNEETELLELSDEEAVKDFLDDIVKLEDGYLVIEGMPNKYKKRKVDRNFVDFASNVGMFTDPNNPEQVFQNSRRLILRRLEKPFRDLFAKDFSERANELYEEMEDWLDAGSKGVKPYSIGELAKAIQDVFAKDLTDEVEANPKEFGLDNGPSETGTG